MVELIEKVRILELEVEKDELSKLRSKNLIINLTI